MILDMYRPASTVPILIKQLTVLYSYAYEAPYYEDQAQEHYLLYLHTVLWIRIQIRIRKDPKLFAGSRSGSVTRGYGSGSETGLKSYYKSSKKLAIC
jgi:hypothetical protein